MKNTNFIKTGAFMICMMFFTLTSFCQSNSSANNQRHPDASTAGSKQTFNTADLSAQLHYQQSGSKAINVPAAIVTGNRNADVMAYKAVMEKWVNENHFDYINLDQKTKSVLDAGDYAYFFDYEVTLNNFVRTENK